MALGSHERVGKTLKLLNTPECCRRSMMEWLDQARICLAESLPKGSRIRDVTACPDRVAAGCRCIGIVGALWRVAAV